MRATWLASSLLLFASPMPFTSTCNALAVATAVAARRLVADRCGTGLRHVSADRLHALMRRTARPVWDGVSGRTLPLVQPDALYAHIRRAERRRVCAPADVRAPL